MLSCRSIFPGVNGPIVDLNLLRANRLYGDASAKSQKLIDENEERQGWLIFYSHDVGNEPSPYGCTSSLLESTVKYAVGRGCRVMSVQDVLIEIGVKEVQPCALEAR